MPTPFRLTPSAVARYFSLDCDRFLRFSATPEADQAAAGIPDYEFDRRPLLDDILESGYVWEERVVGGLLAGRAEVAGGTGPLRDRRFDAAATVARLRTLVPGRYLYQGTLVAPPGFYAAVGLSPDAARFGECHPDLIEVRDGPDARLLRVIDVKRGESLQLTHRVQVLLYGLILEAVLADAGVADVRVDRDTGGVWLGDRAEYEPFDLASVRPYVANFLADRLPRLLAGPAAAAGWHVTYRCEQCGYRGYCRDEMRATNDVSRLTNLTAHGKRHLGGLGVRSLPELEVLLARPDADEQLGGCASLAGERHYLGNRAAAFRASAPRSHGSATALPKGENIAVFVTLQQEPLGRSTYLAGLLVHTKPEHAGLFSPPVRAELYDAGGRPRPVVRVAPRPEGVTALRDEFVTRLHGVLADVHRHNLGRPWDQQLGLQTYTHTERDREQLTAWLLECLAEPALAGPASSLLLHFQCPDLMLADDHPDQPVPFPVVVLQNVLTKMVALPVEVSYTLPETLAALGGGFQYPRKDYYHYPLGHGLRSEAVHAGWHLNRPDRLGGLRAEAAAYLFALRALLWAVRGQVGENLFAWPPKFALPAELGIANPVLSRLAFFTQYESVTQYLRLRERRAEPPPVRSQLGLVVELVAVTDAEFDLVRPPALDLDATGLAGWLLNRATAAGRQAQLEFRDYASRDKMYCKPSPDLAMAGVERVDTGPAGPTRVRLKYATPFAVRPPVAGERFELQPRFTDFNTARVIDHLREMDRTGGGLFLPLLADPAAAARVRPLPGPIEAAAAAGEAAFGLTESQRGAYREVRRRRVVAVWGPPGTGKTHCLAALILGLVEAHAAANKPFRVLVTAFTHAAIENLLRKIGELQAGVPVAERGARVGKVKEWHGARAGDEVKEDKWGRWLAAAPTSVSGATVYSCLKGLKKTQITDFDLVVVDEASQLRVAEAAVPVSLVAADGRLILAGDDLQLPPVVQGVYPDPPPGEPILHRSVFEAVRGRVPADSPVVRKLLENRRMNDVLTSFAAGLLYGPDYRCFDAAVAARRIQLFARPPASGFLDACLDPAAPLVFVVLDGVRAAAENAIEARLAADLIEALRDSLADRAGRPYPDDRAFFRDGVFVVSPHRAQNRAIRQELATRRAWTAPPFVDTVDKMQGQEAEAVVVSYGVSDPEYALNEGEFIYSVNRLNVAITRARAKCVVFLSRPLLDSLPGVLDSPAAERGLAFMRNLVDAAGRQHAPTRFDLAGGVGVAVYRASAVYSPTPHSAP